MRNAAAEEFNGTMADAGVPSRSKIVHAVLSAFFFAAFIFQLAYFAVVTSATLDEPTHILAGYRHLRCGDFGINPEHPPMLKMIAGVPLMFRTIQDPPWECGSKPTTKPDSFLYGAKFIVQNGPDATVIPSRLAAAVFSLILAVLVFAAAWRMFGRWEALVALALLAFEPNFIANGAIVTTDATLSATALGAVFALWAFCRRPGVLRFAVLAAAMGLMLAAKHSAVIFVLPLFVLAVADLWFYSRPDGGLASGLLRRVAAFAAAGVIAVVVLWGFYGFRYYSIPAATAETISVPDYIAANGRPEMVASTSARIVENLDRMRLLPESYVLGLADIVATGSRNMHLFDKVYPTGRWFYFPVTFSMKTSIALLLLLPLAFVFAWKAGEKRREMMFLLVPALLFFAVAMTSGINIGVRHILPVYPFLIVAAAGGAVWAAKRRKAFRYVLVILIAYHAVTAARTAPDYMPFVNDLWGGPDKAYLYFRDPNLDFGQNTKFVLDYLRRENITECWYASHGNTELTAASQPCRILPGTFQLSMTDEVREPVPPVIEGTVLVTAMAFPPRNAGEYEQFYRMEPVAVIGRSVFVYRGRFEVPKLSALSHADRSSTLLRFKRNEEALADARRAVELAPEEPRARLALGIALARVGDADEARRELSLAASLAEKITALRNTQLRAEQELKRLDAGR